MVEVKSKPSGIPKGCENGRSNCLSVLLSVCIGAN